MDVDLVELWALYYLIDCIDWTLLVLLAAETLVEAITNILRVLLLWHQEVETTLVLESCGILNGFAVYLISLSGRIYLIWPILAIYTVTHY